MLIDMSLYREFTAMQYYNMDARAQGNLPIRWGALRQDIKDKFLAKADEQIKIWLDNEAQAKLNRERLL